MDTHWGTFSQRNYTLYFKGASCTLTGLEQPSPAACLFTIQVALSSLETKPAFAPLSLLVER